MPYHHSFITTYLVTAHNFQVKYKLHIFLHLEFKVVKKAHRLKN